MLLISIMFVSSCKKDACENVSCLNGGECNDGTCVCPSGFRGEHCETAIPPNEKFIGSYTVTDNCSADEPDCSGSLTYVMVIRASGDNAIYIDNYFANFNNVYATVSGNTFTVPAVYGVLNIAGTEQWDIDSGSGSLNGNTLTLVGQADDILYDDYCGYVNCTGSGTKN